MLDDKTTVTELKNIFETFMKKRGWDTKGSAKDLSMDIVSEAAELMDMCIFIEENKLHETLEHKREAVENEVADIAFALFNFCIRYNIDLTKAIQHKMKINAKKHMVAPIPE